jgi:PAS domain-containing protein
MREAAQAMAFVEAHIGSLFEFVPTALLMTDANGLIVRANPEAERVLAGRDLLGQPVRQVLPFLAGPSASHAWSGRLPGPDGPALQVRGTRLDCPPATVHLYALDTVPLWPMHVIAPSAAPRRSRFAPSRASQN